MSEISTILATRTHFRQTAQVQQRAYGLEFTGLPRVEELELGASPSSDSVDIRTDQSSAVPEERVVDADGGVRQLADGRLLSLDRRRSSAVFHGPPLSPDLLAHPYLGAVATAFSRWRGRESFHAGAFVAGGRAWAVTGPRTAGKSTLLAALAARGTPVLTDDVLVTDGRLAYPGPRCIDLREPPPFDGLDLHRARRDERHRLRLPGLPAPVPLGGWFFLSWSPGTEVEPVPPGTALGVLASRRAVPELPSDPATVLSLSTLPVWRLRRPRRFDAVAQTLELLDSTVGETVAAGPVPLVHR